jgi:hypothetical protein
MKEVNVQRAKWMQENPLPFVPLRKRSHHDNDNNDDNNDDDDEPRETHYSTADAMMEFKKHKRRVPVSVDRTILQEALKEDIEIRTILRVMKQEAFDSELHKGRNIQSCDVDGSAAADYMKHDYLASASSSSTAADERRRDDALATYTQCFFAHCTNAVIEACVDVLAQWFMEKRSTATLDELLFELKDVFPTAVVISSLEHMISRRTTIHNRFGLPCFLAHRENLFFLVLIPVEATTATITNGETSNDLAPDALRADRLVTMSDMFSHAAIRRNDIARLAEAYRTVLSWYISQREKVFSKFTSLASATGHHRTLLMQHMQRHLHRDIADYLENDYTARLQPVVEFAILRRVTSQGIIPNSLLAITTVPPQQNIIQHADELDRILLDEIYGRYIFAYIPSEATTADTSTLNDNNGNDDDDDDDDDDECDATTTMTANSIVSMPELLKLSTKLPSTAIVVHITSLVQIPRPNMVRSYRSAQMMLRVLSMKSVATKTTTTATPTSLDAIFHNATDMQIREHIRWYIHQRLRHVREKLFYGYAPFHCRDHFRVVYAYDEKTHLDRRIRQGGGSAPSATAFSMFVFYDILYRIGLDVCSTETDNLLRDFILPRLEKQSDWIEILHEIERKRNLIRSMTVEDLKTIVYELCTRKNKNDMERVLLHTISRQKLLQEYGPSIVAYVGDVEMWTTKTIASASMTSTTTQQQQVSVPKKRGRKKSSKKTKKTTTTTKRHVRGGESSNIVVASTMPLTEDQKKRLAIHKSYTILASSSPTEELLFRKEREAARDLVQQFILSNSPSLSCDDGDMFEKVTDGNLTKLMNVMDCDKFRVLLQWRVICEYLKSSDLDRKISQVEREDREQFSKRVYICEWVQMVLRKFGLLFMG